jgi:hypothetical protein
MSALIAPDQATLNFCQIYKDCWIKIDIGSSASLCTGVENSGTYQA